MSQRPHGTGFCRPRCSEKTNFFSDVLVQNAGDISKAHAKSFPNRRDIVQSELWLRRNPRSSD